MYTQPKKTEQKGFTLIELLIVIAIIGFLAAAVLVAVDPVKRIQDARDARRFAEVNAVLNAILTKQVDDRAVYSGAHTSPIKTDATNSQVIVTDDSGIVCNAAATRPGCGQTLDTSTANKACVALLSNVGTGSGTATSSGTAVTGSGSLFSSQVSVGDVLTSASTGTCTVTVITNNTSITCSGTPSPAFSGTYTVTYTDASTLAPTYIASVPIDPRGSGATAPCTTGSGCTTEGNLAIGSTNTGYYVHRTTGNRIEIGACSPEDTATNATISVKR